MMVTWWRAARSPWLCRAVVGSETRHDSVHSHSTHFVGRQVHHGLIWVWAESGPEAFIESAATPIVTCPDLEDQDPLSPGGRVMRSLRPSIADFDRVGFMLSTEPDLPVMEADRLHKHWFPAV